MLDKLLNKLGYYKRIPENKPKVWDFLLSIDEKEIDIEGDQQFFEMCGHVVDNFAFERGMNLLIKEMTNKLLESQDGTMTEQNHFNLIMAATLGIKSVKDRFEEWKQLAAKDNEEFDKFDTF